MRTRRFSGAVAFSMSIKVKVFALDRMKETLAPVSARYTADVESERLIVVHGDVRAPPFAEGHI